MYQPVKKLKQRVQEKITSGSISIGEEIVTTTHLRYVVQQGEIRQETAEVSARKIPLIDIWRRLLEKHEQLGLIREHPDEYYATLSEEELQQRLFELHEQVESHWTNCAKS